jgi:hypothetical protein
LITATNGELTSTEASRDSGQVSATAHAFIRQEERAPVGGALPKEVIQEENV